MNKILKIFLILCVIISVSSCKNKPEDLEMFIGYYEGTYQGYIQASPGFSYYRDDIKGEEAFSIIYNDDKTSILFLIDNQIVEGIVRGKRAKFESYTVTTTDGETGQKASTSNAIEGRIKDNKFEYSTIIRGNIILDGFLLPVDGYLSGSAVKINN